MLGQDDFIGPPPPPPAAEMPFPFPGEIVPQAEMPFAFPEEWEPLPPVDPRTRAAMEMPAVIATRPVAGTVDEILGMAPGPRRDMLPWILGAVAVGLVVMLLLPTRRRRRR